MSVNLPMTKPCNNCPGTMTLYDSPEDETYYACPDCYAMEVVDKREVLDNVYDELVHSSATIKITK